MSDGQFSSANLGNLIEPMPPIRLEVLPTTNGSDHRRNRSKPAVGEIGANRPADATRANENSSANPAKVTAYDVFVAFNEFTEIADLWQCRYARTTFVLIVASLTALGRKVISRGRVRIAGRMHSIECVANGVQLNYNALGPCVPLSERLLRSAPPPQKSPQNIVNALNDDCLLAIFKPMHLLDLCAVAGVCRRFKCIVTRVFEARYRRRPCHLTDLQCDAGGDITLSQIERCFRAFGATGVPFDRYDCPNVDVYLRLIAKHRVNLIELRSSGVRNAGLRSLAEFGPSMRRLKRLTADAAQLAGVRFGADWLLEGLHIERIYDECLVAAVRLPALLELGLSEFGALNERLLRFLLVRNPQVAIVRLAAGDVQLRHLRLLSGYLPHLTELHVRDVTVGTKGSGFGKRNGPFFGSLKRLTIDEVHGAQRLLQFFVTANVRIEELTLKWRGRRLSFAVLELLRRITSITKLTISAQFNDIGGEFVQEIRQMGHLRELHMDLATNWQCFH